MSKVLVTGASGFVGSHLVELLVREGHTVKALARHSGNLDLLDSKTRSHIEFISADLRDARAVTQAVEDVDTVFHLGSIISVPYSVEHPEETFAVNVQGTENILCAMRQYGTRHGVFISTCQVYGATQYLPIDEKHPLAAKSPYAESKIRAEELVLNYYRQYQTPVVIIRPFNTYGPHQSMRAVIPVIISQALTKSEVVLGALHTVRDYTYVSDTARGMMLAANSDAALGQIINLGSGYSVSVEKLAHRIIELVGRPVTLRGNNTEQLRPGNVEADRLEADNRLAAALLNWQPKVSLETGLQRTINWIQEHLDQFNPDTYLI